MMAKLYLLEILHNITVQDPLPLIYNGTPRTRIARINSSGTLDTSFDPGGGADAEIFSLNLQSDGKIFITGNFESYNGTERMKVARLDSDGSLDGTFFKSSGANAMITSVLPVDEDKIIVAGHFTKYKEADYTRLVKLNSDASIDTDFNPGTGANSIVNSIALQDDGKIVIVGSFTEYNGVASNRIARVNSDGSLDTTFDPGTGASGSISEVVIQNDDKILILGAFTSYNGIARNRVARVNSDGSLDTSFNPGDGPNQPLSSGALALQDDGKILIGGNFTSYAGVGRNRIARINTDGSLDTTFDPGSGANGGVEAIVVQDDGRILIGGSFTTYDTVTRNRIARVLSTGELDFSFGISSGANGSVVDILYLDDGDIFIVGAFTTYESENLNRVARINNDGSVDTRYYPAPISLDSPTGITLQNNKLLISGQQVNYNELGVNYLLRVFTLFTADFTCNIDTSELEPGTFSVIFKAVDEFGNTEILEDPEALFGLQGGSESEDDTTGGELPNTGNSILFPFFLSLVLLGCKFKKSELRKKFNTQTDES